MYYLLQDLKLNKNYLIVLYIYNFIFYHNSYNSKIINLMIKVNSS